MYFERLQKNNLSIYNSQRSDNQKTINTYTINQVYADIFNAIKTDIDKLKQLKNIEEQSGGILDIIGEDLKFRRNGRDDTDYKQFLNIITQRLYSNSSYADIVDLLRVIPNLSDFSLQSNFLNAKRLDGLSGNLDPDSFGKLSGVTGEYNPATLTLTIEGSDNLSFPRDFTKIVDSIIAGGVKFSFIPTFRLMLLSHNIYVHVKNEIRINSEKIQKILHDGLTRVTLSDKFNVHVSIEGDTVRMFKNVLDGTWSLDRSRVLRTHDYIV